VASSYSLAFDSSSPADIGTTFAGSSSTPSRSDHVHALQALDVSFEAYQADGSEQSMTSGATTVLICNTETKDTNNYYNTSTGRFAPTSITHRGTYEFHAAATIDSLGDGKEWWIGFQKNGGADFWESAMPVGATSSPTVNGTQRFYLDGQDDYVEVILFHNHGSNRSTFVSNGNPQGYGCRFWGYRISQSDICGT